MTKLRTLRTGLMLGESARWHEGMLWLADWGTSEILRVDREGRSDVVARVPSRFPITFDWTPAGQLVIVAGAEAKVLRTERDGSLAVHADLRHLAAGWNEIVVHPSGNLYVNGSDFDFRGGGPFVPGIIVCVDRDGQVRRVADGLMFANGMAITPDGRTLIVAESFAGKLTAFDIADDGSLSNRRVWAELGKGGDGICLDASGAVWTPTLAGGNACIRVREGGEVLNRVELDQFCFACACSDRELFMLTADWRGPDKMESMMRDRTGKIVEVKL